MSVGGHWQNVKPLNCPLGNVQSPPPPRAPRPSGTPPTCPTRPRAPRDKLKHEAEEQEEEEEEEEEEEVDQIKDARVVVPRRGKHGSLASNFGIRLSRSTRLRYLGICTSVHVQQRGGGGRATAIALVSRSLRPKVTMETKEGDC
ncbi:unnamed protein product [Pleuronectes platessa]|uniref:Uncharacterized protein n=1 Tax=Pleuronectes platessa TaxID=8262 RepID=A0A9N7TJE1_PLEPL|nr:unnamed protein product [Pleuronectes platessa]